MLVLFAVYFITGNKINIVNWISCVIGIQGATVGVLGADHTWFITAILLCYVITPVLSEISEKLKEQNIYGGNPNCVIVYSGDCFSYDWI